MAKFYFRYGAMGCGKTRDLLKVWHSYTEKGKEAIIIKPAIDTKGGDTVISRDNNGMKADYVIDKDDNIYDIISRHIIDYNLDCVLVDEAQFLSSDHVMQLADVVDNLGITVICYGLMTDFLENFFPGSEKLFAQADIREEMKAICECGEAATRNVRFQGGMPIFTGSQVAIDGEGEITYKSMCRSCRKKLVKKMNRLNHNNN